MGAAKKGLAALVIESDDGPHARLNTQEIVDELEKATLTTQSNSYTIEEVRRILLLHAAEVCARIAFDNPLPPSRTGMQALTLR
jgi:isoquinoline 1-oxidoreductase beta subunit